ncbi:hypothetical protein JOM56_004964 [Amanita muscaria]
MKFCIALTLLASAGIALSSPLVNNSDGAIFFDDGYVNATIINAPSHGFAKRQNPRALALVMYAIVGIADQFSQDLVSRAAFTQGLVSILYTGNPNYNYVICHVDHDYSFEGVQGADWDHIEIMEEDSSSFNSFDVVVGGAGTFVRHGDGGFINKTVRGNKRHHDKHSIWYLQIVDTFAGHVPSAKILNFTNNL